MNTEEQVCNASNPQEAMLAISRALDRIEAALSETPPASAGGWSQWGETPDPAQTHDPGAVVPTDEVDQDGNRLGILANRFPDAKIEMTPNEGGELELVIPPPDEETAEKRREFAQDVLDLGIAWNDLPGEAAIEAYVQGGPIWLFHVAPELMAAYNPGIQTAMLKDIEDDYPREAYDIGREIMKDHSADRPSLGAS